MARLPPKSAQSITALIACLLFAACDSGPSSSEFLSACLKEGARQFGIDKGMGISRDAFCKCASKQGKSTLSANGYQWMTLNMAGNRQEAAALQARMSEAERMTMATAAIEIVGKCGAAR